MKMSEKPDNAGYIKICLPEDGYKIIWYEDGRYEEMGIGYQSKWGSPWDSTWKGWDYLIAEPVTVEWVKGDNMYSMAISEHIELVVYTASPRPSWEVNVNGDSVYSGYRDSLDDAQRTAKNAYNTNIANRPELRM